MALGVARDDPLAGAPALDAHLEKRERASAPMEKRVQMNSGVPLWVSKTFFLCVSRSSSQAA